MTEADVHCEHTKILSPLCLLCSTALQHLDSSKDAADEEHDEVH